MIKNFEEVKRQLSELSSVINSYKSETVQLRIVEIVLGGVPASSGDPPGDDDETARKSESPRPARKKATPRAEDAKSPGAGTTTKASAKTGKPSPIATLNKLLADGFFKKGKSLSEIVAHCETKLAIHLKQSNFSGPLIRLVRDTKLTREKNAEGQYVYQQA